MQQGTNRALGYTLATALTDQDLEHVSGGQAERSVRQSVHVTGSNLPSADAQYDIIGDFDI